MSTTETTIQPTVGRLVYYKAAGSACGTYPSVERAALVTAVNSPTNVSLCVFNPTGLHFNPSVERGDQPMQWDWMPYQKEQAALKAGLATVQSFEIDPLPSIGETVLYVDAAGIEYDAFVEHVWPSTVNLTYHMQCGGTNGATSVAPYAPGMTGNYFKRLDAKTIPVEHIG